MLEKWKTAADKEKLFGAYLTDLSKAFGILSHDLLLAKLNAYRFSLSALKLEIKKKQQQKNRKQRNKIDSTYSS